MSSSSVTFQNQYIVPASLTQDGAISTSAQTFSGIKTFDEALINNAMPALTGTQDVNQWLKSLRQLHIKNTNTYTRAVQYAHGATAVQYAYAGGVYSPTQNRIYFVPDNQATLFTWHYIDCATGNAVAYVHGATAVVNAYRGGVYSPTQNRIYLIPYRQGNQANWHYIDCATGSVVAYAHGVTALLYAYAGGVYSPTQNRIYLAPNRQANQANWHYIDCNTGSVVAYAHGVTAVSGAYWGGVYSPTQNRIYFAPYGQSNQTNWHYIQPTCDNSGIIPYMFGSTILSSTL